MTHSFPTRRSFDLLRGIVNGVDQPEQPLDRALIQIRREIAERLEAKGLCLERNASADSQPLPPPQLHALRSILRETVSNAIKHSACTMLRRSEEHTSELQSLMRISYAVFCLKKKNIPSHYN